MKHIVLYFIFGLLGCVCCLSSAWAADRPLVLKSPGGNLEVEIITEGQLAYALKHKGKILLDKSPIGLVLEDRTLGENVKVRRVNRRSMVKEDIVSPHYRFPAFVVTYNELDLKLRDNYGVVFRAYDEGIAYRFYTSAKSPLVIKDEVVRMNFPQDYETYMAYSTVKPGKDHGLSDPAQAS